MTFDLPAVLAVGMVLLVFAIVLLPVAAGMLVRWLRPAFAVSMDRPVRIALVAILAIVIAGALVTNREILAENFGALSGITAVFYIASLAIGYFVPRSLRLSRTQSIASSFEIGIHNATLAIVIAQTVLGSIEMSLPAAVYGVLMFFLAAGFGFLIRTKSAARTS